MNSRYSRIHLLYHHPTQEQTAAYFFLSLTIYHSNSQSGWDGGLAVLNESRVTATTLQPVGSNVIHNAKN
jgi:hypothetical protein